jgi:hypothetical protein
MPVADGKRLARAGSGDDDVSVSVTEFILGAGVAMMASNTVAVTAELRYDIDSRSPDEGDSVSGNQFKLVVGIGGFL